METNSFSLLIIIGIGVLILIIIVAIYKWNHASVYGTCDWCGKEIPMYRKTWRWYYETGTKMYCSGRFERADESSKGVKEKRYRIINHE